MEVMTTMERQRTRALRQPLVSDLREYVDHLSTLTAKVATDGTILIVGKAAEIASGWPMERLVGSSFLDGPWWTFDGEVHDRVVKAFSRVCAGERVSYRERIFILGGVRVIQFSLVPALGARGEVRYVVAEGTDVTAQVEAEDEVERGMRRLDLANRELESFNYMLSHDVRAPVRRISELVGLLEAEMGAGLSDASRDLLDRINRESVRITALATDLMVLSRIGHTEVRLADVDLSAIAAETLDRLARHEPARLAEIRVEPGLSARTDEGLVRIVIENLLQNAWKFTSRREVARIEFFREGEGWAVRDNGAGFDPARAHELFAAFRRLHSAQEFEGTGIGLATVRRIVERLGGKVRATGAIDGGATFWFSL